MRGFAGAGRFLFLAATACGGADLSTPENATKYALQVVQANDEAAFLQLLATRADFIATAQQSKLLSESEREEVLKNAETKDWHALRQEQLKNLRRVVAAAPWSRAVVIGYDFSGVDSDEIGEKTGGISISLQIDGEPVSLSIDDAFRSPRGWITSDPHALWAFFEQREQTHVY